MQIGMETSWRQKKESKNESLTMHSSPINIPCQDLKTFDNFIEKIVSNRYDFRYRYSITNQATTSIEAELVFMLKVDNWYFEKAVCLRLI